MVTNIDDNWTYCLACYVRRNHIYDPKMEAWRCEFCGVVNNALTQFKKVAKEVAEENPKEE